MSPSKGPDSEQRPPGFPIFEGGQR
jgi:hypothetical protein